MEMAGGDRKSKSHDVTVAPSLVDLGITKMQSSRWRQRRSRRRLPLHFGMMVERQIGSASTQCKLARTNLALLLEPLIAAKAKENQKQSEGAGKKGCQKSDNLIDPIDTKKEVAKATKLVATKLLVPRLRRR